MRKVRGKRKREREREREVCVCVTVCGERETHETDSRSPKTLDTYNARRREGEQWCVRGERENASLHKARIH